jgi:pentatricopeptide repeat protein
MRGVQPDHFTFVVVLNACASAKTALEEGWCIHQQISSCHSGSNLFVGNSLVDMYAKCGSLEDVQKVFDMMLKHNVVSWSTMIVGHMKCGQAPNAFKLFQQMQHEGVQPDLVIFVGVLNACASACVHEQIIYTGSESDFFVGSSQIDMYAKCGSMEDMQKVFIKMPTCNVVC